jgi:hypothetical protein
MIWLTWRQFRAQAVAVYAAVAAMIAVLAITGPRLADLARQHVNVFDALTHSDRNIYYTGIVVLAIAPAIIGVFWGAPLVARELETGTHRLVWNQSITRTRWLATKLGIVTAGAALAVGALTLATSWWARPLDGLLSSTRGSLPSRITPVSFAMRGIVPVSYTVFAVILGVTVGTILRRTLPAMAVTLVLFTFVQIAVPMWIRPHLVAPTEHLIAFSPSNLDGITLNEHGDLGLTLTTGSAGDWVLSNRTVDAHGTPAALPSWIGDCLPKPPALPVDGGTLQATPNPDIDLTACFKRLNDEGYRQRVVFQPASHFWRLQWTESALFLVVSGLLTGLCFWWTRKRLS